MSIVLKFWVATFKARDECSFELWVLGYLCPLLAMLQYGLSAPTGQRTQKLPEAFTWSSVVSMFLSDKAQVPPDIWHYGRTQSLRPFQPPSPSQPSSNGVKHASGRTSYLRVIKHMLCSWGIQPCLQKWKMKTCGVLSYKNSPSIWRPYLSSGKWGLQVYLSLGWDNYLTPFWRQTLLCCIVKKKSPFTVRVAVIMSQPTTLTCF